MLRYIIQMNYACILICVFLLLFILTDNTYQRKVRHVFGTAMVTLMILTFIDIADYYIACQAEPLFMRNITSALGYIFRPLLFSFFTIIIRRGKKKRYLLVSLPLIINSIVATASIWTGWVFVFDEANCFHHGPLWILPTMTGAFYLMLMIFWTIRQFYRNGWGELHVIAFIAIICSVSTILESIFEYRFLLNVTIAICLSAYYSFLHVQIYKRDVLTNLLNRRIFYLDAEKHANNKMVIVCLDIDNLKKINDENGHEAGDAAILAMVEAFQKAIKTGCTLYRTGGDEFFMLAIKHNVEEVEKMLKKVDKYLMRTSYSVSAGVAVYEPGDDFLEVCKEADQRMYERKRESKLGREENEE